MIEAVLLQIGSAGDFRKIGTLLAAAGMRLCAVTDAPSSRPELEAALRIAAARPEVRLVLTVGGAGVCGPDDAPEALKNVTGRALPGIPELIRSALPPDESALFRGAAGLRGNVLMMNLPEKYPEEALACCLPALIRCLCPVSGSCS